MGGGFLNFQKYVFLALKTTLSAKIDKNINKTIKKVIDTRYGGLDSDIFTISWKQYDYRLHDESPIDILTPSWEVTFKVMSHNAVRVSIRNSCNFLFFISHF